MNRSSSPPLTSTLRWLSLVLLLLALSWSQRAHAQSVSLTNLWSITPATNTFINTVGDTVRGMAFNPVTGHLLVVSRNPVPDFGTNVFGTNCVFILNATNGAVIDQLPYDTNVITGGNFPVNMVGVTDDGVIYVGNLTTEAATNQFKLYRWASETAQPQVAYAGDPSGGNPVSINARRFGDSMAVRGTGANTQILLGTLSQFLALLRTVDGTTFTATSIFAPPMPSSDARWGLAWGAGNTFWVKQNSGHLRQLSMDLTANTAIIIKTVALTATAGPGGPLDVDLSRNLLALLDATNHKLYLYDITDPLSPIQQDTAKSFPLAGANGNGVGTVLLRAGKLFALECNNGLLAFSLGQTNVPASIAIQPAAMSLWQGATYKITAVYSGSRPFTYQWQLAGTNLPGATQASLTLTNISFTQAGNYRVAVSNAWGGAVSANAAITLTTGNASDRVTNIWTLPAGSRPYLTYRPAGETLTGYKEYGVAINPLNNNVIVVTRQNPTNMIAVLDSQGNHLRYLDYSSTTLNMPNTGAAMNRVDVADDGIVYVCNFAGTGSPFIVYAFDESGATSDKWVAFNGDPASGATSTAAGSSTNNWGYTFSVRGSGLNTEILIGSSSTAQRNFAILKAKDELCSSFTNIFVSVDSTVIAGFSRLGFDWGPTPGTVWAKTSSGDLYLVEYTLDPNGAPTGTATKSTSYPQLPSLTTPPIRLRSVPSSFCDIKYDAASGLLAGLRNGTGPSPVSMMLFDVSNTEAGPLLADQEFFPTYNGDIEFLGCVDFANGYLVALGLNNGLMMCRVNSGSGSIPVILSQPAGGTSYVGTPASFSVIADSTSGLNYQWYHNGQSIQDAIGATYTIPSVTTNDAGTYTVRVSNGNGYRDSAPAALTVLVPYQTPQMTKTWSLSPGDRTYLNTDYKEYGMAFNPATSNLLVISLEGGATTVAVLDALTGADKHILDVGIVSGGLKALHKIGVADDGVVYAGNLTTTATATHFKLYRWDDDSGTSPATVAFDDDPAPKNNPNKQAGYTFGVRGAGTNTQVILGSANTNVVTILTTTNGTNFVANEIKVASAPANFCRLGLCFGPGNTFWAKAYWGDPGGSQLKLVQYDLTAGTGTVLNNYASGLPTSSSVTSIAYDDTLKMIAGIGTDTGRDSVQVFDMTDLAAGPQLRDQELFPTGNPSVEQNGSLAFGAHTYLFALAENNGIMAFVINAKYGHFKILSATPGAGSLTLTWEAADGLTYQVQRASALNGTWTDLGSPITATGSTASYVDTAPVPNACFYRVVNK